MNCAIVCVVLILAGNAGGFVLNRTSKDLEQSVRDYYDPMKSKMQPTSTHNSDSDENYSEETKEIYTSKSDFEKSSEDYLDLSLFFESNPYATHMAMKNGTRNRVEENAKNILLGDIDENMLKAIWSAMPASLEDRNETVANNTLHQGNGTIFKEEDRFLSESLLKSIWNKSTHEESATTTTPGHLRTSIENLEPDGINGSGRAFTIPLPSQRSFSHGQHSILTLSENNASRKHISTLLILTLACFFLVS